MRRSSAAAPENIITPKVGSGRALSDALDESTQQEEPAELAAWVAEPIRAVPRLQYLHTYSYVFEGGEGMATLALTSVCMMIPIIGPIVLAGYQYEIVAELHRSPKQFHPKFDFSRFGEYLGRGIWKFLADMITQFFMWPIYLVVIYGGMFAIILIGMAFSDQQGNNAGTAMGFASMVVVPLAMVILLGVTVALRLVVNPLVLKASLSGEGGDMFDFPFMVDFVRRTWRETFLELLWVYVTFPIMILLGLLCCGIGVFPAVAWAMLADAHTNWQLYEIYLARGGKPIRLRVDKPGPVVRLPAEHVQEYATLQSFEDDQEVDRN